MKTDNATQAQQACKLVAKPRLAHRYTVSPRTIDNWMKNGVLPFIKIGKKFIRFDPDECDAAIARFKIKVEVKRRAVDSQRAAARQAAQQKAKPR